MLGRRRVVGIALYRMDGEENNNLLLLFCRSCRQNSGDMDLILMNYILCRYTSTLTQDHSSLYVALFVANQLISSASRPPVPHFCARILQRPRPSLALLSSQVAPQLSLRLIILFGAFLIITIIKADQQPLLFITQVNASPPKD